MTPIPENHKFWLPIRGVEVGTVAQRDCNFLVHHVRRPLQEVAHVEGPPVAAPHWPLKASIVAQRQIQIKGPTAVI